MNIVKRQFKSSSGDKVYTAVIDKDTGASSCGCLGWTMKRKNQERSCKHTKLLLAEFGFQPIAPGYGVLPAKAAKGAVSIPTAPKWASKPAVTPAVFAAAQAEVEKAVAMVKGKRMIEVEGDDDPVPAKPLVWPAAKMAEAKAKANPVSVPVPEMTAADVEAALNGPVAPKVKPMLASAMPEDRSIADFTNEEWVLEEKFDGHRLTLVVEKSKVTGWSRPGAERPAAVRALPLELQSDASHLPVGTYDGELFIPGGTSSDVVRIDLADKLKLVLFDVIEVLGVTAMDKPLIQRRALLELCVKHCPKGGRVLISEQQPVSLAAVQAIWAAKGEGAILKKLDATYRSGYRTPAWVKVKLVSAAELTITGFEAGKNGPFSVAKLKHDDGRETSVKVLTQELLRAVEKDSAAFVGKRLVVSHMGKTSSGALRHAVWDHLLETA